MSAALSVLGMLELPEGEVPPENIWHSDRHLTEWFEEVKRNREARSKGLEPVPGADEEMDGDWTQNELTRDLVK